MKELILKNRSYRRFYQEVKIDKEVLEELIDLARISASGANMQPLKYIISSEPRKNELIFEHLKWAGYLTDWNGPEEGEKPAAYIIMLGDKNIKKDFACDQGIASQNILLGAVEKGFGGCMIGAIDRGGLKNKLSIPDSYEILLVIALGKPKETVVLEELEDDGNIKYWRDEDGVHHVPKRKLKDVILDS
jgi:nitroreductase